jgi:hypothetical protein
MSNSKRPSSELTHSSGDDAKVAVKWLHHGLPLRVFNNFPGATTLLAQRVVAVSR